jgi:catechol O-methyltransferase
MWVMKKARSWMLRSTGRKRGGWLNWGPMSATAPCELRASFHLGGHLYSVEFNPANADVARRVLAHAGAQDRVTVVTGTLGDGGSTLARLKQEIGAGGLDFVFIDHAKEAYVPDLERILDASLLHPGSIVVADNVRFPGAPEYQAYMDSQEGIRWRTTVHHTHAEYQTLIKDIVLESMLIV